MTPNEQIIEHDDGKLYLVEWIPAPGGKPLVTRAYTAYGECINAAEYPQLRDSLSQLLGVIQPISKSA
jgi:hypothetical protein